MSDTMTERFEGTWEGEEVSPKRTWSGHRFTDEEVGKLLAGETIEIMAVSAKTGKEFSCRGKLARLTYNGQPYIGFQNLGFTEGTGGVDGWCKYTFTEDERKDLLDGKTVKVMRKFVGRSGRFFSAEVRYNKDADRIELVEFIKP